MNRLTNHDRWTDDIDLTNEYGYKHIYNRLAQYENTGLMPEEIKTMQWISVEDKLPEESDLSDNQEQIEVLVYINLQDSHYIREDIRMKDRFCKRAYKWCWGKSSIGKITHWMPLPESPKGELK